ncbi:amidohydrolase [Veillonella ratti]|uniref:amidohydrolase n=1 Tax=Veillonella ratti TaxID=103892 RepID=UPI000F8EF001|nr:amidohydrolase [Veillonella ratti]
MDTKRLQQLAVAQQEYVVAMRRKFYEHPEISGQEVQTRKWLIEELEKMGVPYELLPGTGIIAVIKGGKTGKNKVLRADIDALPLQEECDNLKQPKKSVSKIDGICHACGHDAHMAVLLGTMKVLTAIKSEVAGTVYCCFEEGEEINCGIDTMIAALEKYSIDECFALHVYSGLDAGTVNIEAGSRMAGTVGIGIYIHGKSGHGSRPDQAINPIIPAAHIITQLNSAFMNQLNVEETVTLGIGMVKAGEATNIIPNEAYIGGTARFFNKVEGEKALAIINRIAENTALSHGCTVSFQTRHCISPYPVVNDSGVATRIENKLAAICGTEVLSPCERWYASECYSAYLLKYPGALGFLGIRNENYGSGAAHHNGKFDIDESGLYLGVCAELAFIFE